MPKLNQLVAASKQITNVSQGLGEQGERFEDYDRLPSFVYPIDAALGGGLPLNIMAQCYGPAEGGKNTIATRFAKATEQFCFECLKPRIVCKHHGKARAPKMRTMWIQNEGTPDRYWFDVNRCDINNVFFGQPEYGEECCHQMEAGVQADDVGLVVLDSLAGLIPLKELERDYTDLSVGEQARLTQRLVGRVRILLGKEERRGHRVAVLVLNQIRAQIGGFGGGETVPGGHAAKHGWRLSFRVNQVASDAKDMNQDTSLKSVIKFTMSMMGQSAKQQLLVMGGKAEYKLAARQAGGYDAGTVFDIKAAMKMATSRDYLRIREGGGYRFAGKDFRILKDMEDAFYHGDEEQRELGDAFKWTVVQMMKRDFIKKLQKPYVKMDKSGG